MGRPAVPPANPCVIIAHPQLQAEGAPAQSGREAVMGWLAALADANAARLSGGEMGALRSVGVGECMGYQLTIAKFHKGPPHRLRHNLTQH